MIHNYFIALTGTFHGWIKKIVVMSILDSVILENYSSSLQIITIIG